MHFSRNVERLAGRTLDVLINQVGDVAERGGYVKIRELADPTSPYFVGDSPDISRAQIRDAISCLRENMAEMRGVWFVSKRGSRGGVGITRDFDLAQAYASSRARSSATDLDRVLTGSLHHLPHEMVNKQDRRSAELLVKSITRAVEDLRELAAS